MLVFLKKLVDFYPAKRQHKFRLACVFAVFSPFTCSLGSPTPEEQQRTENASAQTHGTSLLQKACLIYALQIIKKTKNAKNCDFVLDLD